jgi:hypothetical protein
MPPDLLTDQERTTIDSAQMLIDAQAQYLVALRLAVLARLLREALPTAACIVVDTGDWYYATEHGDGAVNLLAVLDERHNPLWTDPDADGPVIEWRDVRAVTEAELLAALRHTTPHQNRWTNATRAETAYPLHDALGADVYLVALPSTRHPSGGQDASVAEESSATRRAQATQFEPGFPSLDDRNRPGRPDPLAHTVYQANDPPPPDDQPTALLAADGRLFVPPNCDGVSNQWCHFTCGRTPWADLPFPLVAVPIPDYAAAITSHLAIA